MKTPMWWLLLAVGLCVAGAGCLMVFALLVWPPGAVGVLGIALLVAGLIVDVPKGPKPPGT